MAAFAGALLALSVARADTPPAAPPGAVPAASASPAPAGSQSGLAVLAAGDTVGAAWPLAQAVYASSALRPAALDENHARVLAGEKPPEGSSKELADLAETRAAIRGDDAPSRQLLTSIATGLHVRGIVVVMSSPSGVPFARVFVAEGGTFDAARYTPDLAADGGGGADWSAVAASLSRTYGAVPASAQPPPSAPSAALAADAPRTPKPKENDRESSGRPFYSSPWFWAAVGAAAFGGAALYFATRDNGPGTIHLQLQVPK